MLSDSGCIVFFLFPSLNLSLFITVPFLFASSQNLSAALSIAVGGGEELLCLLHVLHMNDV